MATFKRLHSLSGEVVIERKKIDEHGNLVELWHEVGGVMHGTRKIWSGEGVLIYEATFRDGKEHGEVRVWNDAAALVRVCNFDNGELHGSYWSCWSNGKVKEEGNFRHGKRVAPYSWYDQSGEVFQTL